MALAVFGISCIWGSHTGGEKSKGRGESFFFDCFPGLRRFAGDADMSESSISMISFEVSLSTGTCRDAEKEMRGWLSAWACAMAESSS